MDKYGSGHGPASVFKSVLQKNKAKAEDINPDTTLIDAFIEKHVSSSEGSGTGSDSKKKAGGGENISVMRSGSALL